MPIKDILQDVVSKATNRRGMLKSLALAGAALGASRIPANAQAPSAIDVVQLPSTSSISKRNFTLSLSPAKRFSSGAFRSPEPEPSARPPRRMARLTSATISC